MNSPQPDPLKLTLLVMIGDGIISSVYTLPVPVGSDGKLYPLQVDTGSSDSVRFNR